MAHQLYIGTKKGAFILKSDNRIDWKLSEPILFGNNIYHMVPDPRDPNTILIATRTGHLGPTIYSSRDNGKTWSEATEPPRFPEKYNKSIDFIFWLTPGHKDNHGEWYAGTSPQGLFVTKDHGLSWNSVETFNDNPLIKSVTDENFGTPIGPLLHSINVSPDNPNEMILAMSLGGAFHSKDKGQTWKAFNKNVLADFLPEPYPETGQCVHNMQMHPKIPSLIYQQGHCGIYRININDDDGWTRIGNNMPEEIGDIGFPLILHPYDTSTLWVIPMDSTEVWPRTSVDGKPALYKSIDSGNSWERQDNGLPDTAWFTVLRQASTSDKEKDNLGIYFGNRNGQIWGSIDEGKTWKNIVGHLPDIYSLEYMKVE